ncbi:MAG: PTS fructose transporter subunit IIA [Angelakisella sp.]
MRKILIACHGRMAEGVTTALNIIIGQKEHISYINAYVEGTDVAKELENYFNNLSPEDEALVFTDLYGGSVNQSIVSYAQRSNVRLVSGFNLAVVLELALLEPDSELTDEDLDDTIAICAKQMKRVKKCVQTQADTDDFDI